MVEGSLVEGDHAGSIAITIRAATPGESFELLCRTHGLTPRERQLGALVIEGLTTSEIAKRLVISSHTVKDHVKSIFEKTGARSRRELMARVAGDRRATVGSVEGG